MSVVGRATRRRWLLVAAGAAVLAALPAAVAALPAHGPIVPPDPLAARIAASAAQPYSGYAVSHGAVNLPSLPALGDVIGLFNGDTSLRIWYGSKQRWRVDTVSIAGERDVYQTADAQTIWDSGQNQFTTIIGGETLRLPRGPDLAPPDLARRLLSAANQSATSGHPVTRSSIPAKRVAGVTAAGLRLTPTDPHTTVGHIDIWADPKTGLPLEVDVLARGGGAPVMTSRLLDVTIGPVAPGATAAPKPPRGVGQATTTNPDVLNALHNLGLGLLPDSLLGMPRSDTEFGQTATVNGEVFRFETDGIGAYGTGFSQILAASVPGRTGFGAFRAARNFGGVETDIADGDFVVVSTPLLNVVVARSRNVGGVFILAGLIDSDRLTDAARQLLTSFGVDF